jgi:CDP-6-deoxy-D-xylo-4-hexulose-3-dehydrase
MLKLSESSWNAQDFQIAHKIIDSDQHTMGEKVSQFESSFAKFVGSKYAVMVNSGSSANLLGVSSLKFLYPPKSNSNVVIVPALSWSTTYFPWIQNGFRLRFVDIDPETFNMDISAMQKAIDSSVVGICVPHILGADAGIAEIARIANEHGIWIFEDTCESLGAYGSSSDAKMLGTFGEIGTYSFFRSHHISTMEGGMVVTNNEDLYHLSLSKRAHGWGRDIPEKGILGIEAVDSWQSKFQFYVDGYNLRPLEISGALGISQLSQVESFLGHRRENAIHLQNSLSSNTAFRLQKQSHLGSWMAFGMTIRSRSFSRSEVTLELEAAGVETRPIVTGNFLRQPVIRQIRSFVEAVGDFPGADFVHQNGLMFGNHGRNLEKELDSVVEVLEKFSMRS